MRLAYTIRDMGVLSWIKIYKHSTDRTIWTCGLKEAQRVAAEEWRLTWCLEPGVCEQTCHKLQKHLLEMAWTKQEVSFAEVTPLQGVKELYRIAKNAIIYQNIRQQYPHRHDDFLRCAGSPVCVL